MLRSHRPPYRVDDRLANPARAPRWDERSFGRRAARATRAALVSAVGWLLIACSGSGAGTQVPAPRALPLAAIDGVRPPLSDYVTATDTGQIWGGALTGTPNESPCRFRLDIRIVSRATGQRTVASDSGAIACTWIAPTHAQARFSLGTPWHQHQYDFVQP